MRKLEKIQRRALKFCVDFRQSTPCNVVLSETCISPLKIRFTFLASKYILKVLSDDPHLVIDKLYDLQINLIRNDRYNVSSCFLLYKAFLAYKKYKPKIACFEAPPIYHFAFDSAHLLPDTEFTLTSFVDELRQAPIPQLLFLSYFNHLLHVFYTGASKIDPNSHVGFAFYSLSLNIQCLYKIHSYASVHTGEALALFCCIDYILSNDISQAFASTICELTLLNSSSVALS